jgi:tetratricopeptide (TPR) repeat protein
MEYGTRIHCPDGAITVVNMGEHEWTFEYPRLSWDVMEEFHTALEHWRIGDFATAEATYRELVDEYPEFIDVHHHLALLLDATGRDEQAFWLWQAVVELGLSCLPTEFELGRDQLPWLILENRPFLRAYHGLGLAYLERGETEKALGIFENILALNAGDNQGARALVVDCSFQLNRPKDVLAVCDRYPGDGMEQLMYGRALALYQLGRKDEAAEALDDAIEFLPLVAKELVKKRHRRPKELRWDTITYGGADQAYIYWVDQGQHWKNTPGAIDFVMERLKKP